MATGTAPRRVIVVGAGFAGLACAHALLRAHVDATLLEARDRVGGRAWTLHDFADDWPVEAGAMMIHGSEASIHRWAKEFGLEVRQTPSLRGGRIFLDGRMRSTVNLGLRHARSAWQMERTLPRAIERYRGPDVDLRTFLARQRATPLAKDLTARSYGSIDAAEPELISVRGLADEANVATGGLPWANYTVEGGIESIAVRRASELGDRVRLRRHVRRIEWSPEGVRIGADSPEGPEEYAGDAAVVAVPLGVLRAGSIGFVPDLPPSKVEAIRAIGMGHANKVLLRFDEAARPTILGKAVFMVPRTGDWYFFPYHGVPGAPVIMEGFLGGRRAKDIAGLPEREVIDEVLGLFEEMVPRFDVRAHVTAARVIDWTSDPLCLGGYTFPAIGGGREVRRRLAEPLDGVLFFAGEATQAEGNHATLHGALDSGERAAKEVLADLETRAARTAG